MGNVARSKTTRGEGLVPRSWQSGYHPLVPRHRIEDPLTNAPIFIPLCAGPCRDERLL